MGFCSGRVLMDRIQNDMRKLLTILLLFTAIFAYGQQSNTTNTKFINGLATSSGANFPTTGLTAGMIHYKTTSPIGFYYYDGSGWQLIGISGAGVTSFNTRTGAVTLSSGDVTTALGFTPVTNARTLTINGTAFDLSANRTWTVTANTTNSLTAGYGLSGTSFNGSATLTWVADTSSATGLVSKSRLASNLGGYLPLTAGSGKHLTGTLYGDLGMVVNGGSSFITSGTGGNVELSGDVGLQLTGGTYINIGSPNVYLNNLPSTSASGFSYLTRNTSSGEIELVASSSIADSLAKKANKTFDNVASGAIANAKLANSSLTIGSTNIALGATSASLTGLTSVGLLNTGTTTVLSSSATNVSLVFPPISGIIPAYAITPVSGGIVGWSGVSGAITNITALPNGTTATTQSAGDNSTKVATTAYVDATGAGTVTSVATNTNTGITGGTITSTGTISADTTKLQTVLNFFPKGDTRYAKITTPFTLSAIGSSPNANGATLSGGAFNLEPANGLFGGSISTSAQTMGAGLKTFSDGAKFGTGTQDGFVSIFNNGTALSVVNTSTTASIKGAYIWHKATTGDNNLLEFKVGSGGTDIGSIDYARSDDKLRINASTGLILNAPTVAVVGSMMAPSFVKSGGTSSEFLKADGSSTTGTTVGHSFLSLTNPSAITFPRINADNSVSALDASSFRTAIGAGTGAGTVSTVSVTTTNGVSGSVANATTTPAITLTLGAITPSSVVSAGVVTAGGQFNAYQNAYISSAAPTLVLTNNAQTTVYGTIQASGGNINYDNATGGTHVFTGGPLIATGLKLAYVAKTSNYTVTTSDYYINCTSGTFTVTLPTAVGIAGQTFIVFNSGAGIITMGSTSSQTINGGVPSFFTQNQNQGIRYTSDGANWFAF